MIEGLRGRKLIFPMIIIILYLLLIPSLVIDRNARSEATALRSKLKELSVLSGEYRLLKADVDAVRQKRSVEKAKGITQAVDEILSPGGLKGKMKSLKPSGGREMKGVIEESAEVRLEKVTLNELMNVLYRTEEAPMPLAVKRISVKKTFENPELFDVVFALSLFIEK